MNFQHVGFSTDLKLEFEIAIIAVTTIAIAYSTYGSNRNLRLRILLLPRTPPYSIRRVTIHL